MKPDEETVARKALAAVNAQDMRAVTAFLGWLTKKVVFCDWQDDEHGNPVYFPVPLSIGNFLEKYFNPVCATCRRLGAFSETCTLTLTGISRKEINRRTLKSPCYFITDSLPLGKWEPKESA